MTETDAGALPLPRRVRLELLVALQHVVDSNHRLLVRVRDSAPGRLGARLGGLVGPVRIPEGRAAAQVPLDSEPETQATVAPAAAAPAQPAASIVVVTYGGLAHTRLCIASVRAFTDPQAYELVIVDNGSTDGTRPFLRELAGQWPHLRVVEHDRNLGFAGGVNAGVRVARGRNIVILNNDTVVTPRWLTRLLGHLEARQDAALVGPVTNDSGDVATIAAHYDSLVALVGFADERHRSHAGRARSVRKLALFCSVVRRDDFERCGGLDEGFGIGMFEDDDLCSALRFAGRRVLLAEDVYVHHAAGASFRRLSPRSYLTRFEVNRLRFERKWGVRWRPTAPPRGS